MNEESAIGWRVWRVQAGRLHSWVASWTWEPGLNQARCIELCFGVPGISLTVRKQACSEPPGARCLCGFWALWDVGRCIAKARDPACFDDYRPVMGLVAGSGVVAIHGAEGFRSQFASVLCLFSDSVWDRRLDRLWTGAKPLAKGPPFWAAADDGGYDRALTDIASAHQVPLVDLRTAARSGLLAEFGIPYEQVERVAFTLA